MTRWSDGVPLLTAAAGCGGTGRELARFGDLSALDAILVGPVGLTGESSPARLTLSPAGLVHTSAPAISPDRVVSEVLPWCRARGLRVVLAIRGKSTGGVVEVLQRLRRSLDFGTVHGVELDLGTNREGTLTTIGGLAGSEPDAPWSSDPQATLKVLSAAREQLPRDLLLQAKIGGECPDPIATARAAVGGGARALVLSGGMPAVGEGQWLAGPATAPLTLGLVTRVRAAMTAARVPDVPIIGVGGVHDLDSALALRRGGAAGVQVGSGILTDPSLLWTLQDGLRSPAPDPAAPDLAHAAQAAPPTSLDASPPDPPHVIGGPHDH